MSWEREGLKGSLLLEADPSLQVSCNVHVADIFVSDADAGKGTAKVVLTNYVGFTQKLERVEEIGRVLPVDMVEPEKTSEGVVSRVVKTSRILRVWKWRR